MKTSINNSMIKLSALLALTAFLSINYRLSNAFAQGTAFTYQGLLYANGAPLNGSYDIQFTLYTTSTGGSPSAGPVTSLATTVVNGLFSTAVDFGPGVFTGTTYWLDIAVRPSGNGPFSELAPRQQLAPTPYAILAEGAEALDSGGYPGMQSQYVTRASISPPSFTSAMNVLGGFWGNTISSGVLGATIAGGGDTRTPGQATPNVVTADFGTISGGLGNTVSGDDSTIAGGENNTNAADYCFIGGGFLNTIFTGTGGSSTPSTGSVIGGGQHNTIDVSSHWSIISGGESNYLSGAYGTLGGGLGNTVGGNSSTIAGGQNNAIYASPWSTIGGGEANKISDSGWGTLGGGFENIAGDLYSTVAGGISNIASGEASSVIGGENNYAYGGHSVVAGGLKNTANEDYSFAAGQGAFAGNSGVFIWSDGSVPSFESTAPNQFLVNASGGVGLGTSETPANGLSLGMNEHLNDYPLYLRGGTDLNNGLSYAGIGSPGDTIGNNFTLANIDGPILWGNEGGALGTAHDPGQSLDCKIALSWDNGGNVTVFGTLNPGSDRNRKENFAPVDPLAVLARVAALPISEWNFKKEKQVTHIGPMAQDFFAAFNVGSDDKHISTTDEGGVALAAIQGLCQQLEKRDARINSLEAHSSELEHQMNALSQTALEREAQISALEQHIARLEDDLNRRLTALQNGMRNLNLEAAPQPLRAAYRPSNP